MANKIYSNRISEYAHENGGRVLILFLLFSLAIYEFLHSGLSIFAIVCISPIFVLIGYSIFKWKMGAFWGLIIANYFVSFKNIHIPVPISLVDEAIELLTGVKAGLIEGRRQADGEQDNVTLITLNVL